MRRTALLLAPLLALSLPSLAGAAALWGCSSDTDPGTEPDPNSEASTNPDGSSTNDGGPGDPDGGRDANVEASDTDGAILDDGGDAGGGPPAVQFIGRFDDSADALHPSFAWPGSRIVARFNGTDATIRLSSVHAGYQQSPDYPSWVNVILDGVVQPPFSVTGFNEDHVIAAGLPLGAHVVEIEKRTEANHGTLRFEEITFSGGSGLLGPPARPNRRIEWISESTIDGFGVEGDRSTTCIGTAPAEFDNVRKSLAFYTTSALSAEQHVISYSGKGIAQNNSAGDTATMPIIFDRALPDPGTGTLWTFSKWTPDVIVISLGGVDYRNGVAAAPGDIQAKYGAFIDDLRTKYGASPYIFMTIWSQVKDNGGNNNLRSALTGVIDNVRAARAADTKLLKFAFPEANPTTDESACYYHANAAHHQAMATLLTAEIKTATGW